MFSIGTVAVAILSKHALRTHWSNIFNPAARALVAVAVFLNTGQDWWGALPDLGILGVVVLLIAGALIADRINKLPMILTFFGVYFALFTVAGAYRSPTVSEIFVTPDLQAALFFAFFMLDDPPTSPVRHEDQVVFGVIVATVSYFVFMRFGGVYFLPAGLLAGNLWESARRVAISRLRERETPAARETRIRDAGARRGSGLAGSLGAAALALPLVLAFGVLATGGSAVDGSGELLGASAQSMDGATTMPSTAANRYPFLSSFDNEFHGQYTQTNDASSAHLVLDGLATGDLSLGLHVELMQRSVVPPPDDESAETERDDEDAEARPVVETTMNTAQLLDPDSMGLLCDGKLTAFSGGVMRFRCDGTAAYTGVSMQIASALNPADNGTISGAMTGVMRRDG